MRDEFLIEVFTVDAVRFMSNEPEAGQQ